MRPIGYKEIFTALRSGRLTDAEYAAFMLIRSFEYGKHGGCTASAETLAAARGVDPRQWRRLKSSLVSKGFLQDEPRGPATHRLRTRLPDELKDRTFDAHSRGDVERPFLDDRADPRKDARVGVRADAREDAECHPSKGKEESRRNGRGYPLSEKQLFAITRKVISDGNGYGFDAYRTTPGFLTKKAKLYGLPEGELEAIYYDVATQRQEPLQRVVDQVVSRARARAIQG
ncbi:MAG: helix-turn-helix domain-containing protein [Gemmatimonadota bacterium]|nr:MAG: helix-turn-helix domain-containing protein [Gemmatimonadota bacterium]